AVLAAGGAAVRAGDVAAAVMSHRSVGSVRGLGDVLGVTPVRAGDLGAARTRYGAVRVACDLRAMHGVTAVRPFDLRTARARCRAVTIGRVFDPVSNLGTVVTGRAC